MALPNYQKFVAAEGQFGRITQQNRLSAQMEAVTIAVQQLEGLPLTEGRNDQLGTQSTKLANWLTKVATSPSTARIAWAGDSTSDLDGRAAGIRDSMREYTDSDSLLTGFNVDANMPNFGESGAKITDFRDNLNGKGVNALIAAAPDLVIFSYGINDVRQNLVTAAELRDAIIVCIDALRAGLPTTDFILRMPNSFSIIAGDGGLIQQGSYPSIQEAAQAQSAILYAAYHALGNRWPNVLLANTQEDVFGRTSRPNSPLMDDQIHPHSRFVVQYLVPKFGYRPAYSQFLADAAVQANPVAPWLFYVRVLEDQRRFVEILDGAYSFAPAANEFLINTSGNGASWDLLANKADGNIVRVADHYAIALGTNGAHLEYYNNPNVVVFKQNVALPFTHPKDDGRVKLYRRLTTD